MKSTGVGLNQYMIYQLTGYKDEILHRFLLSREVFGEGERQGVPIRVPNRTVDSHCPADSSCDCARTRHSSQYYHSSNNIRCSSSKGFVIFPFSDKVLLQPINQPHKLVNLSDDAVLLG